mgnify:CR=1 FL=1
MEEDRNHFVGVGEVVDADQRGDWQLVGLGNLGEGLPLAHSVFSGSRDRGYGNGFEARFWQNSNAAAAAALYCESYYFPTRL